MRAALYVRVSTEEQAQEGYTLEAQRQALEDYCVSEGWEVAGIYRDEGYSGTNINRPAYRRMMDEADAWDTLLVLKMDRIHRNSRNFMNMMDELNLRDKKFVSCMESLDTANAMGRFVVDMMQRLAQLESEQIGERTYMGMREKAESLRNTPSSNKTLGFNPPYGYAMEGGMLVPVPEELETVAGMFCDYLGGSTMDGIAHGLNRRGIVTGRGNAWTVYSVRTVLHNPIYAGYMRWDGILIRHHAETAADPDVYNRVQRLIATKVRDPSRRRVDTVPEETS